MTDPKPIACTLGTSQLRQRLDEIAALGAERLLGHELEDGAHTLRFRRDDRTRRQLEEIVAAEARCCPFLDLSLGERDGELVLALDAPIEGRAVADELAKAFLAKR
ncbi:MAG TPA: hypothetical protein VH042_06720 [Solirubrobacterales bacterium]|nr:hypothetical protein [Solirubrobacterales bacterium]